MAIQGLNINGYVGVILTGQSVDVEYVEEVVVLPVDVTTHCELVALETEETIPPTLYLAIGHTSGMVRSTKLGNVSKIFRASRII